MTGAIDGDALRAILGRARDRGPVILDEAESLDLVEACGIPTVRRARARPDAASAGEAAGRLGFPVVLKGLVRDRAHKTDAGLVHAALADRGALEREAREMVGRAGPRLEGFLIQEHVGSHRELACGLVRDACFGPCVMVGFGGLHAELVDDKAFSVAPLTRDEGLAMLEGLRTRPMLDAYRGAAAAELGAIAAVLVTLGELGLACARVIEVDLNPLIVTTQGRCVAVDALVVLGD